MLTLKTYGTTTQCGRREQAIKGCRTYTRTTTDLLDNRLIYRWRCLRVRERGVDMPPLHGVGGDNTQ